MSRRRGDRGMQGVKTNQPVEKYSKWEYQNIALAAIVQSAALVDSLAVSGSADPAAVRACVNPLFSFNPASLVDIYPNVTSLSLGLRSLQEIFAADKQERNPELVRYLLGILALRQKLMADKAMQERLRSALKEVRLPDGSGDSFSGSEIAAMREIADIYQNTISTYAFRIHVKGNVEFLRDEHVANQIRALLLGGIRSAVLWYQIGGRRWQLILYRKKIYQTSSEIRRKLITTV